MADIIKFYGKRMLKMIKKRLKKDNLSTNHFTHTPRSSVWKIDDEVFKKAVEESRSFTELKMKLNGNIRNNYLKQKIKENNLSIKHFGKKVQKYTNDELFQINSCASGSTLKKRILKYNLLEYKCSNPKCLLRKYNVKHLINPDTQENCEIKLQLDHINGNNKDNRLENLRFLCPQCHASTNTYGRKLGKKKKTDKKINETFSYYRL